VQELLLRGRPAFTGSGAPGVVDRFLSVLIVEILDDLSDSGRQLIETGGEPLSRPVYGKGSPPLASSAMELITILNRCHRFRGLSTSTPTSVPARRASK
jgi:hypothetical protein